jgi:hypothetical protein
MKYLIGGALIGLALGHPFVWLFVAMFIWWELSRLAAQAERHHQAQREFAEIAEAGVAAQAREAAAAREAAEALTPRGRTASRQKRLAEMQGDHPLAIAEQMNIWCREDLKHGD